MPRVDDYQNALEIAQKKLQQQDPVDLARRSGGTYVEGGEGAVSLTFIDRKILVRFNDMHVGMANDADADEIPIQEKVLALHYLLGAQGQEPSGRLITYREIPSASSIFLRSKSGPLIPWWPCLDRTAKRFNRWPSNWGGRVKPTFRGFLTAFCRFLWFRSPFNYTRRMTNFQPRETCFSMKPLPKSCHSRTWPGFPA